ncbi:TonB family protein [Sphingobacterium endophyticum]|uniref:TonB family protein n=1 Tax=Sphingobacterium endophyticum TaxID=2546448 RepID=UPI0012E2AA78|nr:TonB family protein [Sphingobacterium endophyticum]
MNYLLISNLALALFFLIYRFGLKRLTFFNLNRWYLLSSIFIAYLVPLVLFIDFQVPEMMQVTLPILDLSLNGKPKQELVPIATNMVQEKNWVVGNWVQLLYWIGVIVTLAMIGFRILLLFSKQFSAKKHGSYSFFNYINIGAEVKEKSLIKAHEELHVKQGHSYDLLFVELIRAFNWFNPILFWIRDELKFQHECIVDNHFSEDKVAYAELLVAYAMNIHPHHLSHEFSNKSILKERIKMIFKDKSNSKHRLFYLMVLPMAAMLLGLTINCKSPNKESSSSTVDTIATTGHDAMTDSSVSKVEEFAAESVQEEKSSSSEPIEVNSKNIEEEKIIFPEPKSKIDDVMDFDQVEVPAVYPGGLNQFKKTVGETVKYTQAAIDAGARGTVELSFIIDTEGKVQDIKVAKDVGYGMAQQSVEALKKTKDWKPAIHNGKPVAVRYLLPIRFDLTQT